MQRRRFECHAAFAVAYITNDCIREDLGSNLNVDLELGSSSHEVRLLWKFTSACLTRRQRRFRTGARTDLLDFNISLSFSVAAMMGSSLLMPISAQ